MSMAGLDQSMNVVSRRILRETDFTVRGSLKVKLRYLKTKKRSQMAKKSL
jgi:hypothetical protein